MAGYTLFDKKKQRHKRTDIYKEWMTADYPKKCKPEGRRNIGRPQTRWEDDFREEGTGQGP